MNHLLACVAVAVSLLVAGGNLCCQTTRSSANPEYASQPAKPPPKFDLLAGVTEQTLRPYVGQHVIVSGSWHPFGKTGGHVGGRGGSVGEHVYVEVITGRGIREFNELQETSDGTPVEVTGVLRLSEPPLCPGIMDDRPSKRFWFDVQEANVRFFKQE